MQIINPRLQSAIQLHQNGHYHEAEKIYRSLLGAGDNEPSFYAYFSDALNRQGKFNDSLEILVQAERDFPNQVGLKITIGQTLLSAGNFGKARKLAKDLARKHPKNGEVHYFCGNLAMQDQRPDEALAAFEKAVTFIPQLAEAHYNCGLILYQQGNVPAARQKWEDCLRQQPAFVPALLNLGNVSLEQNHHEEAIGYLEKVFQYDAENPFAHRLIGMARHYLGQEEDALEHYKKVLKSEGPSEEIYTLLANVYRDLNRMEEATDFYQKVIAMNPKNRIANENLDKMGSSRIEAWHFDMLGDLRRNEAYEQAINRQITDGDTVLDIGTGSGLLSMMCARAGAGKVYTCETVPAIAKAAEQVISDNGYSDQIQVIGKRSTGLKPGAELSEKVDVLVSEILDSGLLGEGVLPSVRHAKANLLKEGGKIIPAAATVKGVLLQSEHLHSIAPLKTISGFDLSSFGRFQVKEVYRRETLNNVPHRNLSEEFEILPVDFYQLPKEAGVDNPNIHHLEIPVTESGSLHGVGFWFSLHLDDKVSLSSGPNGEMIHWGQAVFSLPPFPEVKAGDTIRLRVEQSEMKIAFYLEDQGL